MKIALVLLAAFCGTAFADNLKITVTNVQSLENLKTGRNSDLFSMSVAGKARIFALSVCPGLTKVRNTLLEANEEGLSMRLTLDGPTIETSCILKARTIERTDN